MKSPDSVRSMIWLSVTYLNRRAEEKISEAEAGAEILCGWAAKRKAEMRREICSSNENEELPDPEKSSCGLRDIVVSLLP